MFYAKILPIFFLVVCQDSISALNTNNKNNNDLFELLILHNNDMHARFEETSRNSGTCRTKTDNSSIATLKKQNCVGGFARTAHEIRRYRMLHEKGIGRPVLYLNAGDTYVGTAWFSVHKWKIAVDFLNLLKPDAMSLGNHEFDNGISGLVPFAQGATFPILAANLNFNQEPSLAPYIKKSVILTISNRKIGIIGHLTPETKLISQPGLVKFLDVVESIKNESEVLHSKGVHIILALGHSGFETDKAIAAGVPLVDVVIGGHTNTFLWNGKQPDIEKPEDLYPTVVTQPNGKKVPVVQAYAYTKYLGRLNLTFDSNGELLSFAGQPQLLDTKIPQDGDVIALLEKYRPEVEALDKKVIGKSYVMLDSTSNKCRVVECNFGNLIADAMVAYMATLSSRNGWTDVPIGLVNGGGIRTTIDPTHSSGNITRGDLLGALPFGNQVVSFKMKGSDLVKSIEIGARSNGETSRGEFLQVSGLRVVLDMNKESMHRVKEVLVRCGRECMVPSYKPIDLEEFYDVVTFSFLTNGGDGHYLLQNATVSAKVQDLDDVDTVEWYLNKYSPVYPEEEGRIVVIEKEEKPTKGAGVVTNPSSIVILVLIALLNLLNR